MYAGGVSVIADPGMGRVVFEERVKATQPKWALVDDVILLLRAMPPLMALARRRADIPDMPAVEGLEIFHHGSHSLLGFKYPDFRWLLRDTQPISTIRQGQGQEAIIVFTSGTTSKPKGIVHTVGSLVATLSLVSEIIKPKNNAIFYTNLPYFLLIGIGLGVTVVVETKKPKPKSVLSDLGKYRASIIFGPPGEMLPIIEYCKRHNLEIPAHISHIYLGSAPVYTGFLKRLEAVLPSSTAITCIYGMTEILPIAVIDGREKAATEIAGDLVGTPVSLIETRVAADGELVVSGSHMCGRYLGSKESLTEIHTGDTVRLEGKRIVMVGRKKDMILRGNYNIYPTLYEPIIESIPGVRACAMVGIYDDSRADEEIVVAIETDGSHDLSRSNVEKKLRSGSYSIDAHAFPDRVVFMKLPRSGRQLKINKMAIKQLIGRNA
jgi:acyl-CoA synthetase (AMP-forming)/AMP-acid ligase II